MFPLSDQAGTPATPAPMKPAAGQPGKEKPPTLGRSAALSKSQTLAGKSRESRKVARHSRKP